MASTVIGLSSIGTGTSGILTARNSYTSLRRLRNYLSLGSANTTDDNRLKELLDVASRAVDRYTKRYFYPERKTNYYNLPRAETLRVEHDLLKVYGLSHVNGSSEIDTSVYWLQCGDDWNRTPYDRVVLDTNTSGSTFNFSGTPLRAVHLDGEFGYHEDYSNAWVNSGASLTASVTATAVNINLSGSIGANVFGYAPRIDDHQIIEVGGEFMQVVHGTTVSQIRVIRGINGTTAASHASAVTVNAWNPESEIEFSTRRLATHIYHQSMSPYTGRVTSLQLGIIEQPEIWPEDVKDRLDRYKKVRIYAF